MRFPSVHLTLPPWVDDVVPPPSHLFTSDEEKMELAIRLSELNVERLTGGPFGAAIFDSSTGRLVSVGVNLVTTSICSSAHAEIVACSVAQVALKTPTLNAVGSFELVTSCEPCAMCFGATPWSGVQRLLCGAREEDARKVGFDEGSKVADWKDALRSRGIEVVCDVLRERAAAALLSYKTAGGIIYNGQASDI